MTSSKALFYFCMCFIVGIFLQSLVYHFELLLLKNQAPYLALAFLLLGLGSIVLSLLRGKGIYFVIGFCVLFLVLGLLRFQIAEFAIARDPLKNFNDGLEKITLEGQISGEPDVRDSFQKLKVSVGQSTVLVTTNVYPAYRYLDTVRITGKLKTPAVFEDFNYRQYLAKDGIYSVMDYADVALVSDKHAYHPASFVYEKILLLKQQLLHSVKMHFSSPYNFMVSGIVYGQDNAMPQELEDKFNATGLSHVTAVSGSNIVIFISMIMVVLLSLGCWRSQAFYVSMVVIWVYIVLVGFPPSAIRAGIMGSLALLAGHLGRRNTSGRVLVLAGAVMLFQNPLLLWYDIGFQLSFLASLGIIHVKPMIDQGIAWALSSKITAVGEGFAGGIKHLGSIVSVTISAQLLALPVIMHQFGTISLVSLITNVLVLPIIPFIMVLGFLVSVAGLVWYPVGWLFSIPCWLLLAYFLRILEIFAKPWAVLIVENVSWFWLLVYYAILFLAVLAWRRFTKNRFLEY